MRSAAGLIDKDQPGPGLLAQVVIAKVPDHLTLQRQQKIYARKWVPLLESTLTDGGGQMAPLWRDLLSQRKHPVKAHCAITGVMAGRIQSA
ncbi:transposase [Escherichia coli]|nr:transposase [Escherichia coli]